MFTMDKIAKIWSRPFTSVNKSCDYCGAMYEDNISHTVSKCLITSGIRDTLFKDICAITNRDYVNILKCLNETDLLLKLLGANIEPYANEEVFVSVMKRYYKYISDCNQYIK